MDIKSLDKALQEIVKKREQLAGIDYNNPTYDDLEEKLHDDEDALQVSFGEYLENALQKVHDEVCPDNDVLMPIAYLGKGILIESDKYPNKDTRLILVPNPPRILLTVGKDQQEVVWTAQ
jgi:hypothetical protein